MPEPSAASIRRVARLAGASLALSMALMHVEPLGAAPRLQVQPPRVTTVENAAAAVERAPLWRVSAAPTVRIGVVDGAPEYTLHRVAGARVLNDGRIAVLNARTELRFYDPAGRHLMTTGRSGDGPGEFRNLQSLSVVRGDSLLLFDNGALRVSVHDANGRPGRSFQLIAWDAAALADGSVFALLARDLPLTETHRRTAPALPLVRVAPDGTTMDTVVTVSGPSVEGTRARFAPVRFGPAPHLAVGGDRLYGGHSASYEIDVRAASGRPLLRIRTALPTQPVTDRYRTEGVRTGPEGSIAVPYADSFPEFSALLVDRAGNLWVRRYPKPDDERVDWHVYAPDGRIRARLALPVALTLTDVGDDYVLGIHRDELDVETVRKYALAKS